MRWLSWLWLSWWRRCQFLNGIHANATLLRRMEIGNSLDAQLWKHAASLFCKRLATHREEVLANDKRVAKELSAHPDMCPGVKLV